MQSCKAATVCTKHDDCYGYEYCDNAAKVCKEKKYTGVSCQTNDECMEENCNPNSNKCATATCATKCNECGDKNDCEQNGKGTANTCKYKDYDPNAGYNYNPGQPNMQSGCAECFVDNDCGGK